MSGIWRYRRAVAIAIAALAASTLAPSAASAADRYTIVNNCYGLRSVADARFVVKDATGYAATATTVGGATPFRMQATALGRYLLYGPDAQMPSVGVLNQVTPTSTPGRPADWRVTGSGSAFKLHSVANDQGLATGLASRLVLVRRRSRRHVPARAHDRVRDLPRDRDQRHRHPAQGRQPDVQGARLPRRPQSHQRVPVPRRALPLRPALEPLRRDRGAQGLHRPRAQRRRRHVRELPGQRQPRRHARHRRLADLRRLAARRVAHPRGHLLEVAGARAGAAACGSS